MNFLFLIGNIDMVNFDKHGFFRKPFALVALKLFIYLFIFLFYDLHPKFSGINIFIQIDNA